MGSLRALGHPISACKNPNRPCIHSIYLGPKVYTIWLHGFFGERSFPAILRGGEHSKRSGRRLDHRERQTLFVGLKFQGSGLWFQRHHEEYGLLLSAINAVDGTLVKVNRLAHEGPST